MFLKIFTFIKKHKIITIILALIIISGAYFVYQKISNNKDIIRYVTAAVERGTLIVSVSGSGQVSASDQVDVKPKVSGEVVYVRVTNGQEVKKGELLVQIDNSEAMEKVEDAELNLETTRVQLEKLLEPPDELGVLQAENALNKAKSQKRDTEDNIKEGYEDAFNAVTDVFFDLPTIKAGLNAILYSYEIADSEQAFGNYWNMSALINSINVNDKNDLEKFIDKAKSAYDEASAKYSENFINYKNTSRYADKQIIEGLLEETLETFRLISEAIRNEINMLDFWVDSRSKRNERVFSIVSDYQSSLKSYNSKTNSYLSSLLQVQRSFEYNRQSLLDAEYSIKEKELALEKLMEGIDELDLKTKRIDVQRKEQDLDSAREDLSNCYIRAPFDGIVANVNVKKGESVSSNIVATLITKQEIAEISLNEIDVAKVKTGQKATITFDAVEDLTITGEVVEVDTVGTTTQGVVTYNIKIAFDTEDKRIKPGMSLSAAIITDAKQNVLIVPNSAVKQQGSALYVKVVDENFKLDINTANVSGGIIPVSNLDDQQIEVGISNDTITEVLDGIKEGDLVIVQTTSSTQGQSQGGQSQGDVGGFNPNMMRMMR